MNKKYEFTGEILNHDWRTLRRIRALVDIPNVARAGDLGGWIESEDNLSHEGSAWVFDNAKVYDYAKVHGNAEVYGNAKVHGKAEIYGNAWAHGNAEICGNAKVYGDAFVFGDAFVSGDAVVCGQVAVFERASVYGDAEVYGHAKVCGKAILRDGKTEKTQSYICMGPVGSRDGYTTLNLTTGTVCTGCFKGTIDEFEAAVKKAHGDNEHGKAYRNVIALFRATMGGYQLCDDSPSKVDGVPEVAP